MLGIYRSRNHLNDIGMVKFLKILDFPDSRHIEAILELADLDFFDGYLSTGSSFFSFVDDGIRSLDWLERM
jgi:hypothetical protein